MQQRFAARDDDDRCAAFVGRVEALLDAEPLVEELVARLQEMAGAEVEFLPGVTENVRFRMPAQLADTPSPA